MKPRKGWKNSTKWIIGTLIGILIGGIGVVSTLSWQVYQTMDKIYEPVIRMPVPIEKRYKTEKQGSPEQQQLNELTNNDTNRPEPSEAFLILGLDKRPNTEDKGRTDVIMLAVVNKRTKRITLTSIPRDTYMEIAGKGYKDKINHSFQYGIATTIATVEEFTGIRIHHYILFNFAGFVETIDAIGGIAVDVDENAAAGLNVTKGRQKLTGEQALDFVRFRHDADGDFGRNDRHQKIFKAFLIQSTEIRSLLKMKKILQIIGKDVRMDLTLDQIVSFASLLDEDFVQRVEQVKYDGYSERLGPNHLWYVIVPEKERQRVKNLLKEQIQ